MDEEKIISDSSHEIRSLEAPESNSMSLLEEVLSPAKKKKNNPDGDEVVMNPNTAEEDSWFNEVGNFYLMNGTLHDVQFIVGEQQEKIKAVRLPLINQSKTWWSMLSEDSPLVEKGDIHLPDIDPEVFTLLLKHSYGGLDKLDDLSDDLAMKLCYCANKYFMKSLMEKVASRLQPKNLEDLFPALHCLVYYNLHGVEESVKKIVETRTKKILEHPDFLECDVDSVTYICKQETLNCDELTLWKAVVKWAKHKAQSDEGAQLRQWVASPLRHIRLTILSANDLQEHVLSLAVLNADEIVNLVCKKDPSLCPSLCGEKQPRNFPENSYIVKKVDVKECVSIWHSNYSESCSSTSCFIIKHRNIELQSLVLRGYVVSDNEFTNNKFRLLFDRFCYNKQQDLSVKITKITNIMQNTSVEKPVVVEIKQFDFHIFEKISVPTLIDGKGITLQANSKYKVELFFDSQLLCWKEPMCFGGHDFDDVTFYCSLVYHDGSGLTPGHIVHFTYSVADD